MNDLDIQILAEVQGERGIGTSYLMNDGYLYYKLAPTGSAQYFRCKGYRSGCPGRVVVYSNTFNVLASPHNHDVEDVMARLVHRADLQTIVSQAHTSSLATFEDICDLSNRANHTFLRHNLLLAMNRARTSALPVCDSLGDLNAVLRNPDFACLTRIDPLQNILYQGCADSNGTTVILLASSRNLECLRIIPSVFILNIPVYLASLQQLKMCIVGGLWERSVMPLAWILAESEEAFLAGFQLLRSSLNHYSFSHAMCGLQHNLVASSFAQVFMVEVHPTLYDFINDIGQYQGAGSVNGNQDLKQVVRFCCSLPLLPLDRLQVGIDVVKANAMQKGEVTYGEALHVFHHVEAWLKVTLNKFSVCGDVDRTHYGSEQLRRKMTVKFERYQPDFYSVITYVVRQALKSDKKIQHLLSNRRMLPEVPVPLLQQQDIILLLKEVIKPSFSVQLSVFNFLDLVSEKIQHLI